MIYFIQAGEHGPIKIGYVEGEARANVAFRLGLLQVGNPEPLRIAAIRPGGLIEERQLQARFVEGRIRGEWFRADTPGLADLIAQLKADEGVVAWQLREDGLQLCEWCETNVEPPRRALCSDECAQERRRERARMRV